MQEDLGDKGMAEGVNTIACHIFTKQRQPLAISELSYHQPNQQSQIPHPLIYSQLTQGQGWGTAGRRPRQQHNRTDLQQLSHPREAPTTPARTVLQLHKPQEGVWQNLACRPVAGPQKLCEQHWRTGSSHSGTMRTSAMQSFWTVN